MKEIKLLFLTDVGSEAYKKVCEEGDKRPFLERQAAKTVCKEKVVSEKPLKVLIKIKIENLAIQIDLPVQVEKSLAKFGAKKDVDYMMQVE